MKTLIAAILMGLLLVYVWERVEIVRIGYQIEQLKKDKEALRRERDELRVKVSSLTSPDRIARLATDQLGMVRPARGQVVLVRLSPVEPAPGKDVGPAIRLARHKAVLRAR